jgi:hypothetical protein
MPAWQFLRGVTDILGYRTVTGWLLEIIGRNFQMKFEFKYQMRGGRW